MGRTLESMAPARRDQPNLYRRVSRVGRWRARSLGALGYGC